MEIGTRVGRLIFALHVFKDGVGLADLLRRLGFLDSSPFLPQAVENDSDGVGQAMPTSQITLSA
jgi:hypothetical protein